MTLTLPAERPLTSDELLEAFKTLGIDATTHEHAAAHTVDEAQALRGAIPGAHSKNLFVRDKKGRIFLLVLEETAMIDLKHVHELIGGAGRVSFGTPELMAATLGVTPGAVTPFGVANDREGRVTLVLDKALLRGERLNFHPLVNTRTTGLSRRDFLKFLEAAGHPPMIVAMTGGCRASPPPQHPQRLHQMRPVEHRAVKRHHARPRLGREGRDHGVCVGERLRRRRKGGVDRRDLRRVDRHLGAEPVRPPFVASAI